MAGFDLTHAIAAEPQTLAAVCELLLRMALASALASIVAFRPWRRFVPHARPVAPETAHAQAFMAGAGALMIAVIGDSAARAFGLVGLGAFIRFRSGIKDPRDAVLMFVMIGIGMACGRGLLALALAATVFATVALLLLDLATRERATRVRIAIITNGPADTLPALLALFPGARTLELPAGTTDRGRVVLEVDADSDGELDAAKVMRLIDKRAIPGIQSVAIEDGKRGQG